MKGDDIKYMQRALQLAEQGNGSVSPNPMVGCVIVHQNKISGEGYHEKYGEAHAEVNAIHSVKNAETLPDSTVFVTLEPCSHYGKTPPCADLLIEKKVKKVVIACLDPFAEVDGRGIKKLKDAGIEVETGLLEKEGTILNRRFFTFHTKKRPYVILKWAQTSDGFIARENYDSKWISNEYSRQLVHKWRTEEDAILVGKKTALHDNPHLTARDWKGGHPIRILLDSKLEVSEESHLFNEESQTLIFNLRKSASSKNNEWIQVDELAPVTILKKLHEKNIQSLIIEGGSSVLNSFIANDCWDEARIFTSEEKFGKGINAPTIDGETVSEETIFGDQLLIIRNDHNG